MARRPGNDNNPVTPAKQAKSRRRKKQDLKAYYKHFSKNLLNKHDSLQSHELPNASARRGRRRSYGK